MNESTHRVLTELTKGNMNNNFSVPVILYVQMTVKYFVF